jgi:phosphate starvation-inducible PhoH-like protein
VGTLDTDTQRQTQSGIDQHADDRASSPGNGEFVEGVPVMEPPTIIRVPSNQIMATLLGPRDELLDLLAAALPGAAVSARGNEIRLVGPSAGRAAEVVRELVILAERGYPIDGALIQRTVDMVQADERPSDVLTTEVMRRSRGGSVRPKTAGQKRYVEAIAVNTVTFGLGPAGTGKSWLAVAMAVQALQRREVERIVLTRPAVEAGERLGFLPGDLMAKVDPYLRPLYDALNDMVGTEGSAKLMERQAVEVAPLAFMRGRTLNNSFIILDEAQNTTPEQMKMFLTRLGFGSKMVVTGDSTQADSIGGRSGLDGIEDTLSGIDGIAFVHLTRRDVVRHRIVAEIVDAYDRRPASGQSRSANSRSANSSR